MAPARNPTVEAPEIPRWLRAVLVCDRAGSSWYVGTGFFFAPLLVAVSPWPALTAALWVFIALAGLWLGLLGIAMATGLAMVLRSDAEIPEDYWRSILDYPGARVTARAVVGAESAPTRSGNAEPTSPARRPVSGAVAAR